MADDRTAESEQSATTTPRRRLLALVGTGIATGVAGCSGGSGPGTTPRSTARASSPGESTAPPGTTASATAEPSGTTDTATDAATDTETMTDESTAPEAPPEVVVDADGGGDFETVQAAIDSLPAGSDAERVVRIRAGTYYEKLTLPDSKTNVTFVGDGPEETVLTYDDNADTTGDDGDPIGTSGSSSFFADGDGFTARDLTFRNGSDPVAQAVAIRVDADRAVFENCRFVGNQDTLYTHGHHTRQYYHDCYVEGDVDFIFGWATAWFQACEIYCTGEGYVTAASTPEDVDVGYVFDECTVGGSAGEGDVYLGRPWRPYAKTLFRNSHLGDVVNPKGWHPWDGRERTCWYAEYDNDGPGAWSADRVPWAHHLSDYRAAYYAYDRVFTDWDPRTRLRDGDA